MPKRSEVYCVIDGERDYQKIWVQRAADAGQSYVPDSEKSVGSWLSFISGYNQDLLNFNAHVPGVFVPLNLFRKIAALGVACMEVHGVVRRDGGVREIGLVSRGLVYAVINDERQYQDSLDVFRTDGASRSVGDYVTMFQYYLAEANKAWTMNPGDRQTLDVIRKLTAIAVHCMEDHGAPERVVKPV